MADATTHDRNLVRDLAEQVMELAHSDTMAYRRGLWNDVHSLGRPERPPVVCHPGCWEELLPRASLQCQDPRVAEVEYQLRQRLYKWQIGDDTIIDPWLWVPAALELEGEYEWGLPIGYTRPDESRGAWHYVHPVREESDLDRIVPPVYHHNAEASRERLEWMTDLLGDALPARLHCGLPGPGAWLHGWATQLCGVQELLMHMMDRPQWTHRLMGILRDGFLGVMDQVVAMGILTLNTDNIMVCDDLPAPGFDGIHVRLQDLWGRGESQEFQGVGPALYEEFLLNYQKPILARSGLTYYGCCEDLTSKIDLVLSVPNLRKFVCSPWTDLERLVEKTGNRTCIEWRQKATDVVFTSDLGPIYKHLREGLAIAQGVPLHITLQELETVAGRPERLREWAAIAKEVGTELA